MEFLAAQDENTVEITAKRDIAKRLSKSNKKLWKSLSKEKQEKIVDRYYHASDIENIGIHAVLENNRSIRREFAFLMLGLLFGVFGNLFGSVLEKYLPSNGWTDFFLVSGFFALLAAIVSMATQLSAETLGDYKVLEHLLGMTDNHTKMMSDETVSSQNENCSNKTHITPEI